MAARVTATEVKEIMDNCTATDITVDAFITAGTLLIDNVFAEDTSIGDDLLKEIERWFVAHMLASTISRQTSREKLGDADFTYTGKWGENLKSTSYGQMVLTLDFTGKMSANTGKQEASTYAIKSFT
jgi:hypothetical protein